MDDEIFKKVGKITILIGVLIVFILTFVFMMNMFR